MTEDAAERRSSGVPDGDDLELPLDDLEHDRGSATGTAGSTTASTTAVPSASPGSEPVAGLSRPLGPEGPSAEVSAAAGEDSEPPGPAAKRRKAGRWWEFPVLAAVAILVAILVKTFLVQPFYIPSESMERTLHGCAGCNGDKILVNKVVYHSRDPHPGEIIVFSAPTGWEEPTVQPRTNAVSGAIRWFGQLVGVVPPDEKDLVKRVIAVGGQTVRGNASGQVQISESGANGPWRTLDEPYVYNDGPDSSAVFGPVTVPKGRVWVMGDHRNDSADSRYHCGAPLTSCDPISSTVPKSSVIGKAFVIAWPYSRWRTLGTPSTFTSKTGALAGSALPLLLSVVVVAPFWFWRRRRSHRS